MGWSPPPIPGRLSLDGEPPFVGRVTELDTLESVWESVQAGRRQVVFIGGEPGAGKTRLVAELASALSRERICVLFGTSFVDYAVPYQPFVECLEHLLQANPSGLLARLSPLSAQHLLRLTPRIADYRTDLDPAVVEPKEDRSGLFAAVLELLQTMSAERPLALILEDLQWALEPTRHLLSYLVQATAESPLLILATHRSTAPDRSEALTRLMADLYRLPGVHRIDLAGLDVADITRYVMSWNGMDLSKARSSAVVLRDQTGGNPFFIRELLSQTADGGEESLVPPPTVLDALGSRLDALSAESGSVMELAAIVGDEFDVLTLVNADGDSERVLGALDEASNAGLIVRLGEQTPGFRFRHSLAREAVLQRMSSARRVQGHAAVAFAIENSWPEGGSRHAVLAHHYFEASVLGFESRAAEEAELAALHAEATLAYEDAAAWFRRAAASGDQSHHDEWELLAAQNLVRAGDFAGARRIYAELAHSSDPRKAAEAAIGYEDASWRAHLDGLASVTLLDRALSGTEEDPSDPLYVMLLSRKGRALTYAGRADGEALSDRAVGLATALGDPTLLGATLGASVNQLLNPDNLEATVERTRQFLNWAEKVGSLDEIAHAAGLWMNVSYLTGDPVTLDQANVVFSDAIEAGDLPFWRFLHDNIHAGLHFTRGDLTAAQALIKKCHLVGQTFGQGFTDGPYGFQMFMIERELGRLEAVRRIAESLEDPEKYWRPGLLALYAELGMVDRAAQLLELVVDEELARPRASWDWPAILALVAEAVIAVGERRFAEMWRPALAEYSGLNLLAGSFVAVFGAADRYLAQIDAILDLPTAEEHFRAGLELDVKMGSTLHEVESLIAYAAYLDRSTDYQRTALAAEYRQRALAIAERKRLFRQMRRLDESTTMRSDRPAGLTPRELDVLRLVAEGLSNREIADRLFISENTAANHIRKILLKTHAPNRTKAAIFASERGLLT